jgi:hypothetical protein
MGEINMLVAKFVDNDYICNKTKFSNFGVPIEKDMLVLPINEDVSIDSIELKEKAVLLEISEENIVDCQRNTYFKVNKAIPIRNLNDEELSIIRSAACQISFYAYHYAICVDKKPTDKTRTAACKDPEFAYLYALEIDQKPINETRTASCKEPYYAYHYAIYADQRPTNETRIAACKNPYYAYYYALYVDQKPTNETRIAACKEPYYAYHYAKYVDKKPTNKTKDAVSKDQHYKEQYEQWEKSTC